MKRAASRWLYTALSVALFGCTEGSSGAAESFRIRGAEFIEGRLPGFAPTGGKRTPLVTALETANLNVHQGEGEHTFSGRAERTATAVALALDGVSTGYWVVPTGVLDVVTGELTWAARADFDLNIVPGLYAVTVVAIDESGRAGEQLNQSLCVLGRVPDNGRACSADKSPPRAVISLQWDADADLDLQVVGLDGARIDAKHPLGMPDTSLAGAVLDRDSNGACALDGIRTENLIWNDDVPAGRFHVYVNLFAACGQPATRFSVGVYSAEPLDDGSEWLKRRLRRSGELLELSADPRAVQGLFVVDVTFADDEQ
ncbi:MAG: hypothetical protein RL701_2707 [Pseudomonadota bacterium]